jgi:hypothetical protein
VTGRSWDLRFIGRRPTTMNVHRTLHFRARADDDKSWREAFGWLAKVEKVPHLDRIEVVVLPLHKDNRRQDVAACAPAAKAAIDGLVDAGVIPDDTDRHLASVTFLPAVVGDDDGLVVQIKEVC